MTAPYKSTPVFDETTLPAALRREHRTKDGVWGVIRVLEGQVRLVLDRGLADGDGPINAHPLVNTMTTALGLADLLRFFEATGHTPEWLDFPV